MNSNFRVTLAHAVGGEKGKSGNKPGNQGNELIFQNWYNREKGWHTVLRCKNEALRKMIAENAINGVLNKNIGYDQADRYTLWNLVRPRKYDCRLADKPCECDCSSFVATCVAYAGITNFEIKDFYTGNMVSRLTNTKAFKILTANKYTKDYQKLVPGDILVGNGHTAIVGNNIYWLKYTLKQPDPNSVVNRSADIKALQARLNELGWSLEVDGKWGTQTDTAVRKYQRINGLDVDGVVGKATATSLGFLFV